MSKTTALPNDTNTTDRFLSGPEVCRRYGVVEMTIWRWLNDDDYADLEFPQPAFRVRDRRFWREQDLIDWERSSATRDVPARRRPSSRKRRVEA
jgi:predicted DNA-binding transcriptional regulator AlpA